jgi:hypothetical protein
MPLRVCEQQPHGRAGSQRRCPLPRECDSEGPRSRLGTRRSDVAARAETAASARRSGRPSRRPRPSVCSPRCEQSGCPRSLSACKHPNSDAVRKRSEAPRLGAGDAHSGRRRPRRRAVSSSTGIVTSAADARALCHRMESRGVGCPDAALASGVRERRPVSRGGPAYLRSGRSERRRERARRRGSGPHERGPGRRLSLRAGAGVPVMGSECGSPRAVLSPSSGQGVGDGCGDSRGVPALPTSPSAGMLGRSGDSLNHETHRLDRITSESGTVRGIGG